MSDQKEIIPSITPAQDEVASYRRSGRSDAPKQSNFNGLLVFVIVLMAIMMGIGGYTLYEMQDRFERSNKLLEQGQENTRQLDSRLAATGTDVSKTLLDLQAQVNTNFTEIDKLWSVSHRQNKPDIQKNVRAIAGLKGDLGVKITSMTLSVNKMSSQYQGMLEKLSGFEEGLLQDNEELITEIALLRGQVQDQAVVQGATKRNLSSVDLQIKEMQEAINSIDAHRKQIAQKLNELENDN
jgi:septal ring factor EnvC (AmiA/AmiB activator)